MSGSETDSGVNDIDVTLTPESGADRSLAPLSTVLAKVCTCQIDDTNRIDSAECPRHGDSDDLVRDAAWDACMGPDDDKHRR